MGFRGLGFIGFRDVYGLGCIRFRVYRVMFYNMPFGTQIPTE